MTDAKKNVDPKVNLSLESQFGTNKAGYTATQVACWWAGAVFEVTREFGQEQ